MPAIAADAGRSDRILCAAKTIKGGGDLSFPNSAAPDAADQPGLPCRTDAKGAGFPNRLPDSGEGREKAHGTAVAHGLSAPAPRGGTLKW